MRRLLHLPLIFCTIFLLLSAPSVNAQTNETPTPEPDWRFGIIETYDAPLAASEAGAAWTRIRFQWAAVQAEGPESWTPEVTEAQIEREVANGRELVGLLIGIPDWARGDDDLPSGLYLPVDDPDNLWAAFVREAVTRYDGRINHWIIWNEPDIWDKETPGHTWDGTVEDFAQLQKVAYIVAKTANPEAVIHLPAFTYFWDSEYGREQYFGRLLDVIIADPQAEAYHYYFDIATAHLYFQPDIVYNILEEFQTIMHSRAIDKPMWLVETNAPPHDDVSWPVENWTFLVSQQEQAAYIPQVLAVALAAGVERIAIYKMRDVEGDRLANPEPFGLLRQGGGRRPAFKSYQVAANYFSGVQSAERLRWDEVGLVQLNQIDQTTTVLFSRLPAPQTARVVATAVEAVLVDMDGNRRRLEPNANGFYEVELPGALCLQTAGDYCMIGGRPFYLIQTALTEAATPTPPISQLPTITLTTSPPPIPPPSPPPIPTASSTSTLIPTPTPTNTLTPSPSPSATSTIEPSPTPAPTITLTEEVNTPSQEQSDRSNSAVWLIVFVGISILGIGIWRLNGRRP